MVIDWRIVMTRENFLILIVILVFLSVLSCAAQPAFHPSMIEVGAAQDGQHVTFDPPFPSTPSVVVAITGFFVLAPGGIEVAAGCGASADNITASGFDFHSSCILQGTWIATLQQ
jgi:hypothetical protein